MDGARLAALSQRGYRIAADRVGLPYQHFRPAQTLDPLHPGASLGYLNAAFDRLPSFPYTGQPRFGEAVRYGIVNGLALRHGDYLVPDECAQTTLYVAAPGGIHATTCVACNAVLQLRRPAASLGFGAVDYRAPASTEEPLLSGWPGAVNATGRGAKSESDLPGAIPVGEWAILLPLLAQDVRIHNGDVLQDDQGRRFGVLWAESSDLGWRMSARTLAAG